MFTRVEFKDVILGESSRLEVLDGISCVDMGLKVSHVCNPADQAAVENLMRFPLFGKLKHQESFLLFSVASLCK